MGPDATNAQLLALVTPIVQQLQARISADATSTMPKGSPGTTAPSQTPQSKMPVLASGKVTDAEHSADEDAELASDLLQEEEAASEEVLSTQSLVREKAAESKMKPVATPARNVDLESLKKKVAEVKGLRIDPPNVPALPAPSPKKEGTASSKAAPTSSIKAPVRKGLWGVPEPEATDRPAEPPAAGPAPSAGLPPTAASAPASATALAPEAGPAALAPEAAPAPVPDADVPVLLVNSRTHKREYMRLEPWVCSW